VRRTGNLLAAVAEPANLRLAFWKAARGKSARRDVAAYRAGLGENLGRLRAGILEGTVEVGRYRFFKIHEPKQRDICAAAFPERVLHHALMNHCEPVFEKRLIHDTYACRAGKGREAALKRARYFAARHAWFLKLDVRRYFESIDHAAMFALLRRVLKDRAVLEIFRRIIASHAAAPGRGLPIGNLTSQHFANLYLGELDHFAKESLRVRGYVRYMDDFVLWAHEKPILREWRAEIDGFLRERLKLETKPPQINRTDRGMPFLGCRVFPRGLRLGGRGRRRFAAKLRAIEADHARGLVGEAALQQRATALVAHTEASGGRAFRRAFLANHDFGAAAMDTAGSNRVLRGGNWNNNAGNCRAANRNNNSPSNTNNNNGFRAVRSSEGSPQRERDSDPGAVPSAPMRPARQSEEARPGLVGAADTAPGVPGGRLRAGEERMTQMKKHLVITEATETGCSAYSPDLPGCASTGKTREEAESNMREAIGFHLDGLKEEGLDH